MLPRCFWRHALSGCSWFGMDAENLMQPPKPTGEREAIYQLLEAEAASGFTLKYPVNGDYRSAIIMNQNGEEAGEAIAFFSRAAKMFPASASSL